MGRTLLLTTPLEQGDDVKFTQECLQGRRGSYAAWYKGALHGIYDEATAAAAHTAKYYLGYPLEDVDQTAGDLLRSYLQSTPDQLPEDYQARRSQRLNPPPRSARQMALTRAVSQLGYTESPAGSNLNKYGSWYGFNGVAWCAIFQTWCWEPYAPATFVRGSRYAYVPYVRADAIANRYGLRIVSEPIPGDLVLYFWSGLGSPGDSHIGIVESGTNTSWTAIEGNTSAGNNSNGGQVQRRIRRGGDAVTTVFVRVGP
jgi:hypothetical protein